MNEPVFDGVDGGEIELCTTQNRQNEFSCVQVVDESRANAHLNNNNYYSVIQQKKLNKFIVESTLAGGMRLNVPPPAVNMTTTTTIINNNNSENTQNFYVSSSSSTTTTTTVSSDNSGQGSLTIPVNQQTSSVNIVNCYRTVPVQLVKNNNNSEENNKITKESNHKNDEKCDIIEVVDEKNNDNDNNIIKIENLNQITSDTENNVIQSSKQSIYITGDSTNINAITSDTPNVNTENSVPIPTSREQRRRERRERRAARNRLAHIHALHSQVVTTPAQLHLPSTLIANHPTTVIRPGTFEILPDLLHSHLPPPYTTLPLQQQQQTTNNATTTIIATPVPVPVSAVDNCRYSFPLPIIRR